MTARNAVRLGIIGTGAIARWIAPSFAAADGIDLVAVASRTAARSRDFANDLGIVNAFGSYAELIASNTVDAVYIAAETGQHMALAMAAADAGKHVLCEKPLAATADDAARMFAHAIACRTVLSEAFAFRYMPATRQVSAWLSEGAIGEPRMCRASMSYVRSADQKPGGGALLDSGCYVVSFAQLVFGDRARRAWATGTRTPDNLDTTVTGVIDYCDGRSLDLMCSTQLPEHDHIIIFGTRGVIEASIANQDDPAVPTYARVKRGGRWDAPWENATFRPADGYRLEAEAFARLIRGSSNDEALAPAIDTVNGLAALDALRASLSVDNWVGVV